MDNQQHNHEKATTAAENTGHTAEHADSGSASGGSNDKAMGIIAYLGILFIIPLLAAKDSEFAMYHANQGLILFICWVIISFANIVPILGQIVWLLGSLVLLVLMIIGIMNAAKMKKKPLPLIGGFQILS